MSGPVLTNASSLTCQSQGVVPTAAAHRLTVAGASVLTAADVAGRQVNLCKKPNAAPSKTCMAVAPPVGGSAVRLTVDGVPVLTAGGFTAITDGFGSPVPAVPPDPPVPPGPMATGKLTADARQTWLKGE